VYYYENIKNQIQTILQQPANEIQPPEAAQNIGQIRIIGQTLSIIEDHIRLLDEPVDAEANSLDRGEHTPASPSPKRDFSVKSQVEMSLQSATPSYKSPQSPNP
jgi:hypothetical protein